MNGFDLLYTIGAVVLAPVWMRKARGDWRARRGFTADLGPAKKPRIMLHAVSVGEVAALRYLVPLLTPSHEVVVSVGTDTGIARARELYGKQATIVRYPLDFSRCVARFLDAVKPDVVGLVELELWPNFVAACERRSIPVAVINGRLSERSFRGYSRVRFALKRTFGRLAVAAVQDDAYRERFIAMGVPPERCVISGSMKWDSATVASVVPGADDLAREMGIDREKPLVVAGSTAEDEEALLHAACAAAGPDVQLLCAPRKPEHFDEAAAAMPGCARRSTKQAGNGSRFLLDTIGELRKAYALADVVVMGRSFGSLYGSDPIEPAALGKPVVIGPAIKDFQTIVETMERAGAIVRTTRETVAGVIESLVRSRAERAAYSERGVACVLANQGASARHAEMLGKLVKRPK